VDVLEKPTGHDTASWERQLLATVKLVSRIKVIRHIRARGSGPLRSPAPAPVPPAAPVAARPGQYELVVIGASTGGPAAIEAILKALPPDFPLPILFVLHIAEPFASSFLGWLSSHTGIPVRPARDGEPLPKPGRPQVVMAPADRHLVVRGGRLRLTEDRERHSCRPSVDVLFESVAIEVGEKAIACLLTGMGRDGAKGLLAIQRAGGMTLAQDQETSVVYGMPGEAAMLGAASQILPLGRIAGAIAALSEPKP
ncbi:MAG: CheB methylesterase domain-containing protein, partial [Candidatus Sericytochromatia bacterium]